MTLIHWLEIHATPSAPRLAQALEALGYAVDHAPGDGTLLILANRPDPALIPSQGAEVFWWVQDATPHEVSAVLNARPGWVLTHEATQEEIQHALLLVRQRDLGSEGWLRQVLHLATLDELLRLVLVRAMQLSQAEHGAIWIRQESMYYQRAGEGFPEAPIPLSEAAILLRQPETYALCGSEQLGLLRLKGPKGQWRQFLGWIREVEDLLINAWRLERSQELSFKDDLTVAQNRRCLEAELPQAVRDAATRNERLALLFLDVDNLKQLNSAYGHPTGSRVLTHVAVEAQRLIRAQDRLYRYGGDEFCIVLRGTSAQGGIKLGERLIETLMHRPLEIAKDQVPISISIGIAVFPDHADGAEHLVERADRALFRAKQAGKGCVVVAD